MTERFPPPTPRVIGGNPAKHSGKGNHPVTRVVIHSAVMDCEPGAARLLAEWNTNGTTGGSWHYAVDPAEVVQCSFDSYVCHHAPPNGHSIGIEMADRADHEPKRNIWTMTRWARPRQRRMLRRTAWLTAELCLAYDLPLVLMSPEALRAGRKGIVTHATVTAAFGQSTHTDPRTWPKRRFMRLVRRHAAAVRANPTKRKFT